MLDRVREKREQANRMARRYRAERLYVFGSCARREEKPESDIDILADFSAGATLFNMADLQCELQELFGRSVDLVASSALRDDSFGSRVRAEMVVV